MERTPETHPLEVSEDRLSEIYGELRTMDVDLDSDPIELGPRRFNNKVAETRSLLSRLDQIFLQVSEDLHFYQKRANAKKTIYELKKKEALVNNPTVRNGRSQAERESLAEFDLMDEIKEIAAHESCIFDLEAILKVIKSKRTDLKDIQSRMRDQLKLIEHDITMGAQWGSRNDFGSRTTQAYQDPNEDY